MTATHVYRMMMTRTLLIEDVAWSGDAVEWKQQTAEMTDATRSHALRAAEIDG